MGVETGHKLVVMPGLGDHLPSRTIFHRNATQNWKAFGIDPEVRLPGWNEGNLDEKLTRFLEELDPLLGRYDQVSLLGTSASGVLALNMFMDQPRIHKVVTVASRLSSNKFSSQNRTFEDALRRFEERSDTHLTSDMRSRVMTVCAAYGDDNVYPQVARLEGATNYVIPSRVENHIDAVTQAFDKHSEPMVVFLRGQQS